MDFREEFCENTRCLQNPKCSAPVSACTDSGCALKHTLGGASWAHRAQKLLVEFPIWTGGNAHSERDLSFVPLVGFFMFFFCKKNIPGPRSSAELPYGIIEECHLLNHSTSSVFEVVLFQNFGSDENWVVPLLSNSNSHHQGFCIFRTGSRTSPSFVTTVHGSGIPNNHLDLEYV